MNRFFYSPFVQETKFYEPIYEPIHMKAFVPRALKQVPGAGVCTSTVK